MKNHPENLNCNIVKDLLPSYLEDICTAETKLAVDKHLSECNACRKLTAMMRETTIISEHTEFAQINYMKKMKLYFFKTGSYTGIILTVFLLLGLFAAINNYNFSFFNIKKFYLLLPCLLIITKLLIPSKHPQPQIEKKWKVLTALAILFTCYGIFIVLYLLHTQMLIHGFNTFHIPPQHIGPFLNHQLLAILFYLVILYLIGLYRTIYSKPFRFLYMNIYLTCAFIILSESLFLKSLSDISKSLPILIQIIFILLLEGFGMSVLSVILQKKSCR